MKLMVFTVALLSASILNASSTTIGMPKKGIVGGKEHNHLDCKYSIELDLGPVSQLRPISVLKLDTSWYGTRRAPPNQDMYPMNDYMITVNSKGNATLSVSDTFPRDDFKQQQQDIKSEADIKDAKNCPETRPIVLIR